MTDPQAEVDRLHASIPAVRAANSTAYLFSTRSRAEYLHSECADEDSRTKLERVIFAVDERLHELDALARKNGLGSRPEGATDA